MIFGALMVYTASFEKPFGKWLLNCVELEAIWRVKVAVKSPGDS